MLGYDKLWHRCYRATEKDLLAEGVNLHSVSERGDLIMALTERERKILRLNTEASSDDRIAKN